MFWESYRQLLKMKVASQVLVIAAVAACLVALGCSEAAVPPPASTLAPLPTYTPYPTQTPYPTPVEAATATPYPTATARPTQTPYPTLAALPTYTPYPTATAYPTPTALPTHTPYPTATARPPLVVTATPRPRPTSTPTPAVTATPRPTPKPPSNWRSLSRRTDPLTDVVSVAFYVDATTYTKAPYSDVPPTLFVRCLAKETEVFINWDRYMGAIDTFDSKLRWDENTPADASWSESTDNEATFLQRGQKSFVSNVVKHTTLLVRIWDFQRETYDATFQLRGLEPLLLENKDLCGGPY